MQAKQARELIERGDFARAEAILQEIATKEGGGKSGGYRTIIAYSAGPRAV